MTDEIKGDAPEEKAEVQEEVVQLTTSQYEQLLDTISDLQDRVKSSRSSVFTIGELAEEGRKPQKSVAEETRPVALPKEVDNMSPSELAQYIIDEVNRSARPIVEDLETLKVLREIDKCESKYPDFWEHQAEIQKIATARPQLSIEEAYQLAKVSKGGKPEDSKAKRDPVILNLPPRPKAAGERPTAVAPSAAKEGGPETVKAAATQAWDEIMKGKDTV